MSGVGIVACAACAFRSATPVAACLWCGAPVQDREVDPVGTVWSQTLAHLPFEGRSGGYRLVYVDLEDGPRILAIRDADAPTPRIGTRVRVRVVAPGRYEIEEAA